MTQQSGLLSFPFIDSFVVTTDAQSGMIPSLAMPTTRTGLARSVEPVGTSVEDLKSPSFKLTILISHTTGALHFEDPTLPLEQRAAQICLALMVAFEQVGLMRIAAAPQIVIHTRHGSFSVRSCDTAGLRGADTVPD